MTPEMVLAEFRRMTLTPSALTVQPDRGWVLVNKPTVVYTDAADQTLTTTILGTPVTITAHPHSYRWDFGDGAVISTTIPGRPWPQADISHPYVHTGTYTITLTTTWSATFTLADDPTPRDVPGTATTVSASTPFTAEELRSHLVATTCNEDPHAPGCD
ncbi:PKD domain-containing protein [Cellulomonas sp. NTE-D12]|uniref:PKD domain-containing protein n=1 Tax=Cellulomonas sp. NTE-D12 TaxID=2962632 RepID=UPI0030814096